MDISVIKTGGKQHVVKSGGVVSVEKLEGKEGDTVVFPEVLLTSQGGTMKIGTPLTGTKVEGVIIAQKRKPKVMGLKWKNKTRSVGTPFSHRQPFTVVKIK